MEMETLLYAAISLALYVAINYFMFRWIFDVKRRNRHLEAQTNLLLLLAEKHGVDVEVLRGIEDKVAGKADVE